MEPTRSMDALSMARSGQFSFFTTKLCPTISTASDVPFLVIEIVQLSL